MYSGGTGLDCGHGCGDGEMVGRASCWLGCRDQRRQDWSPGFGVWPEEERESWLLTGKTGRGTGLGSQEFAFCPIKFVMPIG